MLLGEKLVSMGKLSPVEVEQTLRIQDHLVQCGMPRRSFRDLLIERRYVSEADLIEALSDLEQGSGQTSAIDIPSYLCQRLQVKVIGVKGSTLVVAPLERLTSEEHKELLEAAFRAGVQATEVEEVELDNAEIYKSLRKGAVEADSLRSAIMNYNKQPESGEVGEVVESIIQDAVQLRASDIHIDRDSDLTRCGVSYRIDGVMVQKFLLTPRSASVLISRLKSAAGCDFADTRHPQDGRLEIPFMGRKIDIRLATLPTSGDGETLTMRILDPANVKSLDILLREYPGISRKLQATVDIEYKIPGLCLLTGPTGTGKSTTLYALLNSMKRDSLNIMTSEDPIEQVIPGIRQSLVNETTGMNYSNILRAQMRQDPDVLVVGEVRDQATAEAILRGAESGHMMMSTLHASSVSESLYRLLNLLTETYRPIGILTLAHHLKCITNQRLGRRICSCSTQAKLGEKMDAEIIKTYDLDPEMIVPVAQGCEKCSNTGYFGRVMVPEALFLDSSESTKEQVAAILGDPSKSPDDILRLENATYHSRSDSAVTLLKAGIIDARTFLAVLGKEK